MAPDPSWLEWVIGHMTKASTTGEPMARAEPPPQNVKKEKKNWVTDEKPI